jgi:hypothetical protein
VEPDVVRLTFKNKPRDVTQQPGIQTSTTIQFTDPRRKLASLEVQLKKTAHAASSCVEQAMKSHGYASRYHHLRHQHYRRKEKKCLRRVRAYVERLLRRKMVDVQREARDEGLAVVYDPIEPSRLDELAQRLREAADFYFYTVKAA